MRVWEHESQKARKCVVLVHLPESAALNPQTLDPETPNPKPQGHSQTRHAGVRPVKQDDENALMQVPAVFVSVEGVGSKLHRGAIMRSKNRDPKSA